MLRGRLAILRKQSKRDLFLRYAVAVGSVVGGWALRVCLGNLLDSSVPYLTLFPAVVFAAWFGGLGPAMVAATLSVVVAGFLNPASSHFSSSPFAIRSLIFYSGSAFVSVLIGALRKTQAEGVERWSQLRLETDRLKQAQQALALSNMNAERARDLLQTTLSCIGDAVIATDTKGNVTFLNGVAQQLTGWSQTDALGRDISEVFMIQNETACLPARGPVVQAIEDKAMVSLPENTVLVNRSGRNIPIEDTAAPIKDQNKDVLGAVLVFRDVTRRRRSEMDLKQSEERLKLALDAGRIVAWDWKVLEDHLGWSDQVYAIHGIEAGEKVPDTLDKFIQRVHPDDRELFLNSTNAALYRNAPYNFTFRIVHSDGHTRWLTTKGLVIRNAKGAPVRMLGATSDITETKLAAERILQQWRTFDTALSNTPDHQFILDAGGRFSYANRSLLTICGKTLDEVLGKDFNDLDYPRELAARVLKQHKQVMETKQPLRDQAALTAPGGRARTYDYILVPVLSADGAVEAVAGSSRDITDRVAAEKALRESEERLSFALEAGGGVGTWDWNIPGDQVYASPSFDGLFALDEELKGQGNSIEHFVKRIHPDDLSRVKESLRAASATGGQYREEFRIVHDDGIRWIYTRGHCHVDEAGDPQRFSGVAFDVTERKVADQKLEESQQRLRAIYDGTYEYIGLMKPDGTVLEANRASLAFDNTRRDDVIGKKFWECPWFAYTAGAPQIARDGVARAADGEFIRYDSLIRNAAGIEASFDISLYPIRNERGEVVLIVPEGRDITELKRTEDELRRSNKELLRLNRDLEEFAYVAGHDLREPLRMINIYTQLMMREIGPGNVRLDDHSSAVRNGVQRMETLLRDLLNFSRTVHTEQPTACTADLNVSLSEAVTVLKSRLDDTGGVITAEPLPLVHGETTQLAQVFQNLIANALKYQPPGKRPSIFIRATRQKDFWLISIADNGIGFEQEYANRIFGLFKRLHREEYPGTGLGLAICKRIVERYGGKIWAESAPGLGATFFIELLVAGNGGTAPSVAGCPNEC